MGKAMITRIMPNRSVKPHVDMAPALVFPHRLHWVISGEEGVQTFIGGDRLNVTDGDLFEFKNILHHSVSNFGKEDRIHAIVDIVTGKVPPGLEGPDPYSYDYGGQSSGNKEL